MPDAHDSYQTLGAGGTAEIKVQRSVFLATAIPAGDEATARALVTDLRRRHHDARHVCSAWRLGAAGQPVLEARHDDGEPAGTAGEPILQMIRGEDLTDTAVAVVRYFGGIKLGTGGLVRAYGGAAAAALAAAPRRTVRLGHRFSLEFPYSQQKLLERLLAAHEGVIATQEFGPTVAWVLWLPVSTWESFAAGVTDQTAGRIGLHRLDPETDPVAAPAQDGGR